MKQKRGQAAITDLFIAIAVFIILITITTLSWELYNIRLNSRLDFDDIILKGFIVTDTLVKSPGIPLNWETNPTNARVIGFAATDRVIDQTKLTAFLNLTDDQVESILKVRQYNYYFVIKESNGTLLASKGAVPSGSITINLGRAVFYENKPRVMEFALWK